LPSTFKLTYRLIQRTNLLSSSKISDESAELLITQTLLAEVFERSSSPLFASFIHCPSDNCQINGMNRCAYCSGAEQTKDSDTAETAVAGVNEIWHWNSLQQHSGEKCWAFS